MADMLGHPGQAQVRSHLPRQQEGHLGACRGNAQLAACARLHGGRLATVSLGAVQAIVFRGLSDCEPLKVGHQVKDMSDRSRVGWRRMAWAYVKAAVCSGWEPRMSCMSGSENKTYGGFGSCGGHNVRKHFDHGRQLSALGMRTPRNPSKAWHCRKAGLYCPSPRE